MISTQIGRGDTPPRGGQNLYDLLFVQRAGALTQKNPNSNGVLPPKQTTSKFMKEKGVILP